jgi:cytochrome c oxidase subunit III
MTQTAHVRRIGEPRAVPDIKRPAFSGGTPPSPPVRSNTPVGANAWLAVLVFLGAEAMFFAGLIGAYIVFRLGSTVWPPPFQPRLPIAVTGVNTIILVISAVTMRLGLRSIAVGNRRKLIQLLSLTALCGGAFLVIQGFEWLRLIHFGLTVSSSVYGGLFYTIIGFHGLHVIGALVWLLVVLTLARKGRFTREQHIGLQTCAMYWTFVVALWPVLYGVVYLL